LIIESLLMISLTNEPWLKEENLNFILTRIRAGVRGNARHLRFANDLCAI